MESSETEGRIKKTKILLPYQKKWVEDKSPLKIWLAARQVGKSFAVSFEAVVLALSTKCNVLILSASERQSKEVMEKVYTHLRVLKAMTQDMLKAEKETATELKLKNGSRIISLPANPDTTRGFSGHIFLDEFAFHKDGRGIYKAMYPTLTRGYRVRITSTPNGKSNMFYELWSHGEKFSKHQTDIYSAVREGLKVDVDELKRGFGDPDGWAQEFECQFIDEATAYITYDMITACEDEKAAMSNEQLAMSNELYLGVDIGRKRDLTVLWLWEKVGDVFWTRMVKRLHKIPFRLQQDCLYQYLPYVRRCCIDATGLGMQLAEEAQERFGTYKVEAVTFTGKVKEDLAVTFRRKFEDKQVRIPIDREIREDIHGVKKFTTSAGNIRFDSERTEAGHSDHFWSGALGIHAADTPHYQIEFESTGVRRAYTQMGGYF